MSEKAKRKAGQFSSIRKWWATVFGLIAIAVIGFGYFVTDKYVIMPLYLMRISGDGFWYFVIALVASIVMLISVFDFPVLRIYRSLALIRLVCAAVLLVCALFTFAAGQTTDQPWIRYYQTVEVNNRHWVVFSELNMSDRHTLIVYECDHLSISCSRTVEYDDFGHIYDLMFKQEEKSYYLYDEEQGALVLYSSDRILWTYPIDSR